LVVLGYHQATAKPETTAEMRCVRLAGRVGAGLGADWRDWGRTGGTGGGLAGLGADWRGWGADRRGWGDRRGWADRRGWGVGKVRLRGGGFRGWLGG